MEGIPSPLQIGSPVTARRPSDSTIPEALRAGSPVVGTAVPYVRPPLARKNTSGASDRLSQLFPSRSSSIASISPPERTSHSRRTSYPSPLVPAADPTYRIPRAPPAPSFHEDTSYDPAPTSYTQQDSPVALQSRNGTKRLLNRLTSLSRGNVRHGKYSRLDDEESVSIRKSLKDVEEEEETVGYDISGLEGLPLKTFESQIRQSDSTHILNRERDLNEASHAAEFDGLEAQLGAGMMSILQKPFTYTPEPVQQSNIKHNRYKSVEVATSFQAKDAQVEAEKTGGIVAVPFDISDSAAGSEFDRRSSMATASTSLAKDETQTSYYFPDGVLLSDRMLDDLVLSDHRSRYAILETLYDGLALDRRFDWCCLVPSWGTRIPMPDIHEKSKKGSRARWPCNVSKSW